MTQPERQEAPASLGAALRASLAAAKHASEAAEHASAWLATIPDEEGLGPLDDMDYDDIRQAVGRGAPTLLLGTSTRSLERNLQKLRAVEQPDQQSPQKWDPVLRRVVLVFLISGPLAIGLAVLLQWGARSIGLSPWWALPPLAVVSASLGLFLSLWARRERRLEEVRRHHEQYDYPSDYEGYETYEGDDDSPSLPPITGDFDPPRHEE